MATEPVRRLYRSKKMTYQSRYPRAWQTLRCIHVRAVSAGFHWLTICALCGFLPAGVAQRASPITNWVEASDQPDAEGQDPPHEEETDLVSFLQPQPLSVNPSTPAEGSGRRNPSTPSNPAHGLISL